MVEEHIQIPGHMIQGRDVEKVNCKDHRKTSKQLPKSSKAHRSEVGDYSHIKNGPTTRNKHVKQHGIWTIRGMTPQ